MILVTLGTQDKKFYRLLDEIENLKNKKIIKDKIIVQAGYSADYKTLNMQIFDLISKEEFDNLMKQANFIITHGGVGSILTALKYHKKVIAISRLKKYKEHVNDHQIQIINNFKKEGYIIGINDTKELKSAILKIPKFKPKEFKSNKENMLDLVKTLIDK